jgi:hypothetical protein
VDDIKKKTKKKEMVFSPQIKAGKSTFYLYTHGRLLKLYWEKEQDQELF